jgi:hypothetical protein
MARLAETVRVLTQRIVPHPAKKALAVPTDAPVTSLRDRHPNSQAHQGVVPCKSHLQMPSLPIKREVSGGLVRSLHELVFAVDRRLARSGGNTRDENIAMNLAASEHCDITATVLVDGDFLIAESFPCRIRV